MMNWLKDRRKERSWKFWFAVIVGVNVVFWFVALVVYFGMK